MKKFKVEFREVEYGFVEVNADNSDEAKEKADDVISSGNANYSDGNERIFEEPKEIS